MGMIYKPKWKDKDGTVRESTAVVDRVLPGRETVPGVNEEQQGAPASKYPESLLVIRITNNALAVASWIFGNKVVNNQPVWVGGAWDWTHKKGISTLPMSTNVGER